MNQTVPAAMQLLPPQIAVDVRHQAGANSVGEAKDAYADAGIEADISPFITDMAEAYGWADLVICRSGALTVAELAAAGVAAILVPFPHAVDDHQARNAEYLADGGAAVILPQGELDAESLARALDGLLSSRKKLLEMATAARRLAVPDAADKVVEACDEWVRA